MEQDLSHSHQVSAITNYYYSIDELPRIFHDNAGMYIIIIHSDYNCVSNAKKRHYR